MLTFRARLLLDSRVVDLTRSYNPIFITISSLNLLYPPLLAPIASCNLLLYQSLPTSIPYRHAMWRRRKDDTGVGTAASRLIT
jgi:hypothetical protein